MAYIVSPYAGAAEFPSDNMPAQLLQQGLQAGYARRMKEMEQKMKLQEEGKKAFDKSYKYANLDLSKVDPIYHEPLKKQASLVAKTMVEAYKENPATFKNNTDIAEMVRKLQEEKSQYESLSSFIKSDREAKKQFEKEGKFDVSNTEYGNLYEQYQDPTITPEVKAQIESIWPSYYTGGNLHTINPKVAPYTWDDYAKEIENLKLETDKRKISFPQKETVVATVMNDPNKKASMAAKAGIDISTEEGEKEFVKRLESYMPESEKPAPQGSGFGSYAMQQFSKPASGKVDFKMTVKSNKGTMLAPSSVTSPSMTGFSTAMPTALVQPSAAYGLDTGKPVNNEEEFKDNKMFEVSLGNVAVLPVYKNGTTRYGGVDVSGEIVDDANLQDPRIKDKIEYKVFAIGQGKKDVSRGSRGAITVTKDVYIPINQVKDAVWDKLAVSEKQSVMQNILDMKNQAAELNKKSTTSAPKESVRKETSAPKEKTIILKGKEYKESKVLEMAKKSGMTLQEYIDGINSLK